MNAITDLFTQFTTDYQDASEVEMSFTEYLELCKTEPLAYATAQERMLKAIGEPELVDTSKDPRLSIIHQNRTIRVYPAFKEFYGMEEPIEQIVSYFRHAAQGLEEKKQVLYLLGPVGGGKSSLAERIKELAESFPVYTVKIGNQVSPINESPLGLIGVKYAAQMKEKYGIDKRYLTQIMSPWAVKRLKEVNGDISKFTIVKRLPSKLMQIAISKTEPGDENNQDISALVGKVDIRKLERYSQNDTDAYSYSGGLCLGNQGVMEFVEMFKAPIKVLHPLLTATQEGNYNGTEAIGAIPFSGIVLAHSNETEWKSFKSDTSNEAFLDRIKIVKVPYCLRYSDEVKIYEKMLSSSELASAPIAPKTLELMARFSVLTRLAAPENSTYHAKLHVYNGENMRSTDPDAKSYQEYKDAAGVDEGMSGISTRFAYKILSNVFNFDITEVAANPIHLFYVLETTIEKEQFGGDTEAKLLDFIKSELQPWYLEHVGKDVRTAFLDNANEFGQNIFDNYITYADNWIQNSEYRDPSTGATFDRETLNRELEAIEKPAGISNPKDFRNEVVNFTLRQRASNHGANPSWKSYEKIREVIEKKIFANWDEMAPIISFDASKRSKDHEVKHSAFIERMGEMGYTPKQTRLVTEWYQRMQKAS